MPEPSAGRVLLHPRSCTVWSIRSITRAASTALFLLVAIPAVRASAQTVQFVPAMTNVTSGSSGFAGDTGLASAAKLTHPDDVAFDKSGNMYIADSGNNAIRRVDTVTGIITTVAGTGSSTVGYTGDSGAATSATLNNPTGVAVDSLGNIYIADTGNNVIREVKSGIISTIAGSTAGTSGSTGNGGLATAALLNFPTALAIDSSNDVYIADAHNSMVRKITASTGIISRYAGTGLGGDGASGGAASLTAMNNCYGIALDASGNLYISDTKNYIIRMVNLSTQVMTTVAGIAGSAGTVGQVNGNGAQAMSAKLVYAQRLTIDKLGNLLIDDTNAEQLRSYNPTTGVITAVAGTGVAGSATGAAINGQLNGPLGVAVDAANNIYIADASNNVVREVNASAVSPYAAANVAATGATQSFYAMLSQTATVQSYQTQAGFADFTTGTITGCTIGASSNAGTICAAPIVFAPLFPGTRMAPLTIVAGSTPYTLGLSGVGNAPAIAFTPGTITTAAGNGTPGYLGDTASPSLAELDQPSNAIVDDAGTIYIADTANNVVREISGGIITTIAGSGASGSAGDGGAATSAQLSGPTALALDSAGDLFIADTGNSRIREIAAQTGIISTVAGSATSGFAGDGSAATSAELLSPAGVAVDLSGNLYIADTGNSRIRMVSATTKTITTIAGTASAGYAGDGSSATSAELNGPQGLALDFNGNLYIADTLNNSARKIALSAGTITTAAGKGIAGYTGDGAIATSATLSAPSSVSVDAAGNLYIADKKNNVIRQVLSANSYIVTIAGSTSNGFAGDDGSALTAKLNLPQGIALDSSGKLYIADTANNRIRLVDTSAVSLAFGTVNPGLTSVPLTVIATNIGNQSLGFSNLSIAANFTQQTSGGADCTAATTLSPGQNCNVELTFQPSAAGSFSGAITYTDNALNQSAAIQTVALSGTAAIIPTSLAISNLSGGVAAGSSQSIVVTAMHNASIATSYTNTVHFISSDPKAILPADYTYTASDSGSHSFTVTFKTAGAQTVSVTDTQNVSLSGTATTTVSAATVATLNVLSGNNQTAQLGGAFPIAFAVQALDAYGNGVSGVTVTFTAPSSGASGIFVNSTASSSLATDVNGNAVATTFTANTTVGSYTVSAVATGVTSIAFNLTNSGNVAPKITLALSPFTSSLSYGQGATLLATLSPSTVNGNSATGSITFYDNCSAQGTLTIGSSSVASGIASLADAVPSTGVHSFTAAYSGDTNFSSSSTLSPVALTINQAAVTLTGPTQTPVVVIAGQAGSVSVSIQGQYSGTNIVPPTGSLSYQIGSGTAATSPIALAAAVLSIPNTLNYGSYFVTVTYPGDDNYQTASISIPLTVSALSQTITMNASTGHTFGDAPITLVATATSGLPVTFKVVSGPGAISGSTLTILGSGSIVVEADQVGNGTYTAATSVQQTIVVGKAVTQVSVSANPTTASQAAAVTLSATVVPIINGSAPTGTVVFYLGTTLLGQGTLNNSGVASYSTSALPLGVNSVVVQYAGDTNFAASSSSAVSVTVIAPSFSFTLPSQTFTIHSGQSVFSTLTLTSLGGYGGSVTFTCSNLPANAHCVFLPSPAAITSGGTATVSFILQTSVSGLVKTAGFSNDSAHGVKLAGRILWPALLGLSTCLLAFRRRVAARSMANWLSMLVLIALIAGVGGCGSSNVSTATPTGTTSFTVTGTDGTITQSANYTLIVQ